MPAQLARISDGGQITPPPEIRSAPRFEREGSVTFEIGDRDTRAQADLHAINLARALTREIIAGHSGVSVDDFLVDRRGR